MRRGKGVRAAVGVLFLSAMGVGAGYCRRSTPFAQAAQTPQGEIHRSSLPLNSTDLEQLEKLNDLWNKPADSKPHTKE